MHQDYLDDEDPESDESKFTLNLVAAEYKEFLVKMKSLPVSEQQFFLIADDEKQTILTALEFNHFEVFGRIKERLMISSAGMMQTYLSVKFKKQAVSLNPVLGLSSVKDIRKNSLENTRDIAFHFPYVSLPDKADNHSALWHRFTRHDFYHSVLVSCASEAERELLIQTSDAVKNHLAEKSIPVLNQLKSMYPKNVAKMIHQYWQSAEEPTIRLIVDSFIDMEVNFYRPDKLFVREGMDLETMYWGTVLARFVPKIAQAVSLTPLSIETLEEIFVHIFKLAKEHGRTREPQSDFRSIKAIFEGNPYSSLVYDMDLFPNLWYRAQICDVLDEKVKLIATTASKDELKQIINQKIAPNFSVVNVLKVLQYATSLKIGVLQQACMIFIYKNFLKLAEYSNFKEFQHNNPKMVKSLIGNLYTSSYFKDVFKAAVNESKSDAALELLFSYREFLNQVDKTGSSAINYAIEYARKDIILKLLALGASVNPQKGAKALPTLFGAMYISNPEIFEIIYKNGFNLEVKHQEKNYMQYYVALLDDPKTYAGILKKTRQGAHQLNLEEALLYRDAIVENRSYSGFDKDLEDLRLVLEAERRPNQSQAQIKARREKYALEKIKSSLLWECKRLNPASIPAGMDPKRSAMKINGVSLGRSS